MDGEPTYYRDGYTRRCRIKAVNGLHGELRFELRPMLAASRDRLIRLGKSLDAENYNQAVCAALARHLVSWNCQDEMGQPMPLDRDVLSRLQPALYDKLFWIAVGHQPSDPLDDADPIESNEHLRALFGEDTRSSDEKNLLPG